MTITIEHNDRRNQDTLVQIGSRTDIGPQSALVRVVEYGEASPFGTSPPHPRTYGEVGGGKCRK